jgi:peroxiredoxin Q/BCP
MKRGATQVTNALRVGDVAPDFSLPASDGHTYTLAQFRGRQAVVLAWFPRAFTRVCTIECRSLAQHGDQIRRYQVAYFMVSVDPLEKSTGFAASERADFPVLSDSTKHAARAYGVLVPLLGIPKRWTFYIGVDGRILAIDKSVNSATGAEDIAATLARLGVPRR